VAVVGGLLLLLELLLSAYASDVGDMIAPAAKATIAKVAIARIILDPIMSIILEPPSIRRSMEECSIRTSGNNEGYTQEIHVTSWVCRF